MGVKAEIRAGQHRKEKQARAEIPIASADLLRVDEVDNNFPLVLSTGAGVIRPLDLLHV